MIINDHRLLWLRGLSLGQRIKTDYTDYTTFPCLISEPTGS